MVDNESDSDSRSKLDDLERMALDALY